MWKLIKKLGDKIDENLDEIEKVCWYLLWPTLILWALAWMAAIIFRVVT